MHSWPILGGLLLLAATITLSHPQRFQQQQQQRPQQFQQQQQRPQQFQQQQRPQQFQQQQQQFNQRPQFQQQQQQQQRPQQQQQQQQFNSNQIPAGRRYPEWLDTSDGKYAPFNGPVKGIPRDHGGGKFGAADCLLC